MGKNIGLDVKGEILERARAAVKEFCSDENVKTHFGEPVIAYISTDSVLFDTFFARGECSHPKKIYGPCHTAIIHYVPFPSEEMGTREAFFDSLHLSMRLNQIIRDALGEVGRLVSNASSGIEWNKDTHSPGWNGNFAAFFAGVGEIGPCGSLHTEEGYGMRVGAMLTDGWFFEGSGGTAVGTRADLLCEEIMSHFGKKSDGTPLSESEKREAEMPSEAELTEYFDSVMTACCYKGARDVHCSEEMIAACPAGAIAEDGIDRALCQDYCATINPRTPSPDVCAKCYRFK